MQRSICDPLSFLFYCPLLMYPAVYRLRARIAYIFWNSYTFLKSTFHHFCSYIRAGTSSNRPVTNSQITKGESVCWGRGDSCGWAREEPSAKSTWSVTWGESCRNQIYPTVQVLWAKPTHSRRINSSIVYPAKATFMDRFKKKELTPFRKTKRSCCSRKLRFSAR